MKKLLSLCLAGSLVSLVACASEVPDDGAPEVSDGTVEEMTQYLNGWSVNALQAQCGEGQLQGFAKVTNNTATTSSRLAGLCIVNPAGWGFGCTNDSQCNSGAGYCLKPDGSTGQTQCYFKAVGPSCATMSTFNLAPGQIATMSIFDYWVSGYSGTYHVLANLNVGTSPDCGNLTNRQDPTKCARSLSLPKLVNDKLCGTFG